MVATTRSGGKIKALVTGRFTQRMGAWLHICQWACLLALSGACLGQQVITGLSCCVQQLQSRCGDAFLVVGYVLL